MNIPYEGATVSRAYDDFTDNEVVNLELGSATNPEVTLTLTNVTSVSDATGPWTNDAHSFDTPDDDPLEVTLDNTGGQQKIYLKIKPSGGLPGGSPL